MFPTFFMVADDPYIIPDDPLLILHFEGSDGSTTITDSSSYSRSFTPSGTDYQIDTAQAKFGSSSIYNSGVGTTGPAIAATVDFLPNSQTFTLEGYVRPNVAENGTHFITCGSGNADRFHIGTASAGTKYFRAYLRRNSVNDVVNIVSTVEAVAGQWYHVCLINVPGDASYFFVDGELAGTGAAITFNVGSTASFRLFGQGFSGTAPETPDCWLDEWRWSRGQVLYSLAGFVPPPRAFPDP